MVGEEGRYGEWEREGIVPREVFALRRPRRLPGDGRARALRRRGRRGLPPQPGRSAKRASAPASGSFGLGITLHNDICLPYFLSYCDEAQRERWLPGIASGELITALAMTEPGIGSDLAAM